jgi:glutamate dehydrogenase
MVNCRENGRTKSMQHGQAERTEQIDRLVKVLNARLPAAAQAEAEAFARRMYARAPLDDLRAASPEDLAGAAVSLWSFGAERRPGTPKVRVFNPRAGEHGWRCGHTVVEVVNDDMPFLVDSVSAVIQERGLATHALVHPIVAVRRDAAGERTALLDGVQGEGALAESVMHIEIDQHQAPEQLAALEAAILAVLADVRAAVADWRTMLAKLDDYIASLGSSPPLPSEEVAEGKALLAWMRDNNFTFLGYRENDFAENGEMTVIPNSGLGLLRDPERRIMRSVTEGHATDLAPGAREFLRRPELLMILKANAKSTVHRSVPLDYIAVKRFDAQGRAIGERRFVGLFTSGAYSRNPSEIPFLRRKVRRVIERAGLAPSSHDGKALQNILDTYPRDELFQISEDDLFRIALDILQLQERPRIRLLVRRDQFLRFISCLVFAPRDRWSTDLRRRFEAILTEAFGGVVLARNTAIGDDALARMLLTVSLPPGHSGDIDVAAVEARLVHASRAWADDLGDALRAAHGEETADRLLRGYGDAFPAAYRENADANVALFDIERLEALSDLAPLGLNLYRPIGAADSRVGLKVYHRGGAIALSDILPVLEGHGLRVLEERPYAVQADGDVRAHIQDFALEGRNGQAIALEHHKSSFEDSVRAVWTGEAANDGFNRLILLSGLDWREVAALRAIGKYLRQAGIAFSQDYMESTLAAHPALARSLIHLFHARLDPDMGSGRSARVSGVEREIASALETVSSLDDDRILRRFLNVVQSIWRTNFYQRGEDGGRRACLAFKVDSGAIADLPAPRPYTEIFVYSPRVEGIHLRGGKVARGGIRWSDRREDFRTEVLGLMKAQMVKNAVIVPVGSKGGFVPMKLPPMSERDAWMAEGIASYRIFIGALLHLTDNIVLGKIVPPPRTVRHDGDDPYLVVAADKGTATFSDIANALSVEHGHWLGDAFASGGSAGYDHKKMGITARGAWELVKRHFREMGKDIQSEDFTAAGVGDMSGDVFGNGALLSKHMRLIAAFDHRHIFIDPNPDPATSWSERKRLFDLPRSSWQDYDAKLISKGGGVFDRKAKSVQLSAEARAALGIAEEALTPLELMKRVLTADVELLYFGGIGTYVKASTQSQADAGDRANDAIRVDGRDLRARVVGEGANLGFTQLGRVEFALNGGRMNTDAIDNSAGVDCSDHEVNIKILLQGIVAEGDMTAKQRDKLLAEMTDEVGDLVLQDNYLQGQAITAAQAQGAAALPKQQRFMLNLERRGRLDRHVESLPTDDALAEAGNRALVRSELAVLLAYSKMVLYDDLLASNLPDDPYFAEDLSKYFPRPLRRQYADDIQKHSLRREIIATSVANSMVNRAGITFVNEVQEDTRATVADIARAYSVVRDVFDLRPVWTGIEALDTKVAAAEQTRMFAIARNLHIRSLLWLLRHRAGEFEVGAAVSAYKPGIGELRTGLAALLTDAAAAARAERIAGLANSKVPGDLASTIADLEALSPAFDIVAAARAAKRPVGTVAAVWYAAGAKLGFDWLRQAGNAVAPANDWERRAIAALLDDLDSAQRALTAQAVAKDGTAAELLGGWLAARGPGVERAEHLLNELRAQGGLDLARLAIAARAIGAVVSPSA